MRYVTGRKGVWGLGDNLVYDLCQQIDARSHSFSKVHTHVYVALALRAFFHPILCAHSLYASYISTILLYILFKRSTPLPAKANTFRSWCSLPFKFNCQNPRRSDWWMDLFKRRLFGRRKLQVHAYIVINTCKKSVYSLHRFKKVVRIRKIIDIFIFQTVVVSTFYTVLLYTVRLARIRKKKAFTIFYHVHVKRIKPIFVQAVG